MTFKVLPLKGFKSLRALNAFHTLILGLKMLPAYMAESYEEFFERVQKMPESDQKKIISEAALFVNLEKEEVEALVCFCADANGVPFSPENMKSMGPNDLHAIVTAVAFEVAKIKIDILTDAEKKN